MIKLKNFFPFFHKNGERNTEKTVKYFWFYASVFFLTAIILILVTDYFQGRAYNSLKDQMEIDFDNNNKLVLSIQQNYDKLKGEKDALADKLADIERELSSEQFMTRQQQADMTSLKIMCEAQTLYIKGSKSAARLKLSSIDKDSLSSDILEQYEAIAKIIK